VAGTPDPALNDFEVLAASTPDDASIALWGEGHGMAASVRAPADQSFPTASQPYPDWAQLAADGDFRSISPDHRPDVTTASNGDVIVVWPNAPGGNSGSPIFQPVVEMSTRSASTGTWQGGIVAVRYGIDVKVATGMDGTVAIVWNDGTNVEAMVAPGQRPTDYHLSFVNSQGTPDSAVRDTRVAVDSTGNVTVGWATLSGMTTTGTSAWRVRASTRSSATGTWSVPSMVSPSGQVATSLVLKAGSTGLPAAAWIASDGVNPTSVDVAQMQADGWAAPQVLGDHAEEVALSAIPAGFVATWLDGETTPTVMAAANTAGSWAPQAVAAPAGITPNRTVVRDAGGTPTLAWSGCTNDKSSCPLFLSELAAEGWSASTAVPGVNVYGAFDVASSPHGLLTVVYAAPDGTVKATASALPPLVNTAAPAISGKHYAGDQLVASQGSWTPTPGSLTYQWNRDGVRIQGATSASYFLKGADVGHALTVTVTAHLAGYSNTPANSSAITPLADSTAPSVSMHTSAAFTTASSAAFSWSAIDSGSGVASRAAAWRRATYSSGFGPWQYPTSWQALSGDTATLSGLATGSDYCVTVRATDRAGNTSAWSTPVCTARLLDDRTVSGRSSGWTLGSDPHAYATTYSATHQAGAWLSRSSASVDRIGVLATRCPACGQVEVYVGATRVGMIDLRASTTTRQMLVLPKFSLRSGTVTFKSLNSGYVKIDGLALSRT
jgi:hypothetical protein